MAGHLSRQLDDAIMPLRCVFCGTRSRAGKERICVECHADLPWIGNACLLCAEPIPDNVPPGVHCPACQQCPPPFRMTIAPLYYEFPVDAGLKALKFGRRLHYAAAFGELLGARVQLLTHGVDALLPVPLHWRRQAFRGFNQAAELCRPLARRFGLPVVAGVTRRRSTTFQSGLSATERSKNLAGAFVVNKKTKFQHVLIVDDVITTGTTTRQLAIALHNSGIKSVSVLAVARAA